MMTLDRRRLLLGLLALPTLGLSTIACAVDANGTGRTEDERAALRLLREEEKLAHDVYLALDAKAPVFAEIRKSEVNHMAAAANLLARYDLDDPAAGRGPGEFLDAHLATLYRTLRDKGLQDLPSALAVGVEIEELDIHDIRQWRAVWQDMVQATDDTQSAAQVLNVFNNLERGSRNHLRVLYTQLAATGGAYTPSHLSPADFEAIVRSPNEAGGPA
jgi:hypothetical protein